MAVPIPATFDHVTREWVQGALAEGGMLDAQVASAVVEPMHSSKGLIGDLATISVTYTNGDGPSSFVLKLLSVKC